MKLGLFFGVLFLLIGSCFAQVAESSVSSPARADFEESQCNISSGFIESLINSAKSELNLSSYAFQNVTNTYCYSYDGLSKSISITAMFKDTESSIFGKSVQFSVYSYDTEDFGAVFSPRELEVFDYTLRYKFLDYLINGTDDLYYISIQPAYTWVTNKSQEESCADLRSYYDSLSGEKYLNSESGSCSVILKTTTSGIRDLVDDKIGYIYYFGDNIKFSFSGFSSGTFDLQSLATSVNCELSTADYYYPSADFGCYGIFKNEERVYFSASKQLDNSTYAYADIYGYVGGKGKISVNAYGENADALSSEVSTFVHDISVKYFGEEYNITLTSQTEDYGTPEYSYLSGSAIIESFNFNEESVFGMNVSEYQMNTYYTDGTIYITLSEPYLQLFIPESEQEIADRNNAVEKLIPYPYWGRNIVITSSKVFSSATIDENNFDTAVQTIKSYVGDYIATGNWELNMTVTGGHYYPLYGYAEGARSLDMDESVAVSQTAGGIQDSFSSQNSAFAEFDEELKSSESLFTQIINWFVALFSLN